VDTPITDHGSLLEPKISERNALSSDEELRLWRGGLSDHIFNSAKPVSMSPICSLEYPISLSGLVLRKAKSLLSIYINLSKILERVFVLGDLVTKGADALA
jgi:hypothetical protein